jgi:hypothetical protein
MTTHQLYTLSDTEAIRITPPGVHSGMDITVQSVNEYGYIYLGGEDVSTTNYGYRLLPNHAWSIELPSRDDLWLVAEIDGAQAAVLTTGLEQQD